MFEKFGEMSSYQEINELAENLLNEGDVDSLKEMITGHMRPCRPGECRETGVFAPKSTKRRRPYLK